MSSHPSPVQAHARQSSHPNMPPSPHLYQSGPSSPNATRLPPPASSPRERPQSSYYDPTSEARAAQRRDMEIGGIAMGARSPVQPRRASLQQQTASPSAIPKGPKSDPRAMDWILAGASSPQAYAQAMAASAPEVRSPTTAYDPVRGNGAGLRSGSQENTPRAPPVRKSNPMAMMNLLSDSRDPPPAPEPVQPPSPVAPVHKSTGRKASRGSQASIKTKQEDETSRPGSRRVSHHGHDSAMPVAPQPPPAALRPIAPIQQGPPGLTVRDTEAAYREIEARDLSDVDGDLPGLEVPKQDYQQRCLKRTLDIQVEEGLKRKKRRVHLMSRYFEHFKDAADLERQVFLDAHEHEVEKEVKQREIEEDKERKKDQQRKRRREKAVADEKIKLDEAQESLLNAKDDEERAKLEKEIQRSEKKIRDTESRLQGLTPTKDYARTESPHAGTTGVGRREKEIAMEGGLMTSFYTSGGVPAQSPFNEGGATPEFTTVTSGRGRGRGGRGGGGGGRARKSKEQKQAEKENAARAQQYLDSGQDLPPLAPKEEERLASYADRFSALRDDMSDDTRDMTPPPSFDVMPTAGLTGIAKFESKGYNQIYEQITRDLAKAVPKVNRIKNNSIDTKQSNARKTAQLAAKEARRWQARTNKSTKDVAARAKRAMREMLGFWKHNERDERELRKAAERQELDKARRAEAEREANRQKRKLNFLISQTELYSHFIGKKVKTDEIEKHGVDEDGVAPTAQTIADGNDAKNVMDISDPSGVLGKKITNFEELDFDADDETALRQAAMVNAQHAIKEAQDRAKDFDREHGAEKDFATAQQDMDEGELNFQNPTSLQTMDVSQPKMLTCQLKEYQLKGLNWLVNLYEQGINGILADEMGLGKTVQSISVMAYLAEVHNIWGPFLVIAPASTLHNWQQEITRFVPTIKVLPYWGNAKDRKILRKFWDRKHITYNRDSPFHVLVTSYQLVVQDTAYFQKVKWQYMILDEAQAIKSSQSSRWKSLLGFHCRNRLLLTGTPIQNNMQELWALLHFIMPSLFDSHDEFSEWFSKDIENHAQSNTKLNEDQLRRLHMILKPFMLRRIKKHVQKELGDKIEEDVFCDLTYRQRAYYTNLRNKISILDLIEKAAIGDDQDTATLMNLVMQFRKVCNHPDLFERADVWSPFSASTFAETMSFMREGYNIQVTYSVRNMIEYWLPAFLGEDPGRLDVAGPLNPVAGWRKKTFSQQLSIWNEEHIQKNQSRQQAFSWLRFAGRSVGDVSRVARLPLFERTLEEMQEENNLAKLRIAYDDDKDEQENAGWTPTHSMLNIVKRNERQPLAEVMEQGRLNSLFNISRNRMEETGYSVIETCYLPSATAPPIDTVCPSAFSLRERETTLFNIPIRRAMDPVSFSTEDALLRKKVDPSKWPITNLLPAPESQKQRYTDIQVPSMRRFVTDSGKLAQLDRLLRELKEGGHRVLLYFQMTRMIDLMEEYLTYRNYKYCRLDGSTKLEDRRDTVAAFQNSPDIFVFLLSTRAGGLGINLTSADTVIFYDSDWNPTIDSQAMDRAHRLGQTKQVTVYRLITRGTIEERIRKRALQKEEVQRVVISGQAGGSDRVVDFNNRSRENNRTKDIALWLADDDQAAAIEQREAEIVAQEARDGGKSKKRRNAATGGGKRKEMSMDEMYHEGEGKFDDGPSHEPSGAATPVSVDGPPLLKKRKGLSKKAKTVKQRLAVIDGEVA